MPASTARHSRQTAASRTQTPSSHRKSSMLTPMAPSHSASSVPTAPAATVARRSTANMFPSFMILPILRVICITSGNRIPRTASHVNMNLSIFDKFLP